MAITGGWDWKYSWKMTTKFLRKQREEDLLLHSDGSDKVTSNAELELSSEGESTTGKVDEDETYAAAGPSSYKRLHEKMDNCSQMKKKIKHLPTLANACDRVGVSDRAATLFVSSLLQDIKAVSSQDTSEVVDRNKIRRVRQKKRSSLKNKESSTTRAIYFGGQKELTIKEEKNGEKCYRKKVLEEHITLAVEPESQYIGHYSLKSGSAEGITKGLFEYAEKNKVYVKEFIVIGCDGTVRRKGRSYKVNRDET